jgi:rhamnose utilization protein RhaD (predicted bifunctional aldolase and dehydrogenase)/NAD(P)-dependent dehydrogenase (short-subunit alcohol dehydrogenase family)
VESRFRDAEAERAIETYATAAGADLALRVHTARLLGEEPSLVLHDGGSASVKLRAMDIYGDIHEVLHVSGEGESLATIEPHGFVALRLAPLRRLAERPGTTDDEVHAELCTSRISHGAASHARWLRGDTLVSSAEPPPDALIHAILPGKYVDHAHADAILAVVNQPDAADVINHIFAERALFVPYAPAGAALAKKTADLWRARGPRHKPALVIADKHGIYTWGETAEESYAAMVDAVTLVENYIVETRMAGSRPTISAPDPELYVKLAPLIRGILARASGQQWITTWRTSAAMRAFCDRIDMTILAQFGCASPEHAAVLKAKPLVLSDINATTAAFFRRRVGDAINDYASGYEDYIRRASSARKVTRRDVDPWPRVILVEGLGALTAGRSAAEAEKIADLYEHTASIIDAAHAMQGFKPAGELDVFDAEHAGADADYRAQERARHGDFARAPLDRRIALVTGAAAGIGLATARALLKAGAHVVLTDRSEAALTQVARSLADQYPKRVEKIGCDVVIEAQVRRAVNHACMRFGGLDIVISNAGGAFSGTLHSAPGKEALRASLELNLLGHQNVACAAADVLLMQDTGGVLLFSAASNALSQSPEAGPYAVAEAALLALMRQYAIDLGPHGVRSNAVSPGRVNTDLWSGGMLEARSNARGIPPEAFFRTNLLGRETTVGDVAAALVYLCTADATTGCVITVDGGLAPAFVR